MNFLKTTTKNIQSFVLLSLTLVLLFFVSYKSKLKLKFSLEPEWSDQRFPLDLSSSRNHCHYHGQSTNGSTLCVISLDMILKVSRVELYLGWFRRVFNLNLG